MTDLPRGSQDEEPLLAPERQSFDSNDESFEDGGALHEVPDASQAPDVFAGDPFKPFDDLPDESHNILTVRALIVGIFCGALVNASNIYLGLKSGWGSSANIFGAIVGFTVLKACSKYFKHIPILGGDFGPRENNIVQTAATAAGGMSTVFTSAFPAMYQLGLMDEPGRDFWRLATLTAVGGYFGLFFATPLRKFFIILVSRDLHLIFPGASATAFTIRGMHLAAEGAASAQRKIKTLGLAFGFSLIMRVITQYAIGILWDWHPFTWIYLLSSYNQTALALESWGWFIEWTPALIGSGMLVGLNVAGSYFFGTLLAWGIIGPLLVSYGIAVGRQVTDDPDWSGLMSYASLSPEFTSVDTPSPRYWLLWPGVACMIAVSFTELACQWRIFYLTGKIVWRNVVQKLPSQYLPSSMRSTTRDSTKNVVLEDSASPEELVTMRMWLPGLVTVLVMTCAVMRVQYDMPIGETILALFLSFFFSFVAVQATGATDITPLTAAAKASQIILGSTTKGQGWSTEQSQRMNLLGGALANIGANQATDLTSDFRVGFLLRTSPKLQWFAQGIGTLFAVFLAPLIFVLFASAYPCINNADSSSSDSCAFQVPAASAWRAVAVAVTEPTFPLPPSSMYFAIFFSLFGATMVLVRHHLWTGRMEWMRQYHPNMMVMSLSFVIPTTCFATATLIGALIAFVWARRSPKTFELFGFAVSAGCLAGEGIGGVVNAVIEILGFSGNVYGTGIGCPAGRC